MKMTDAEILLNDVAYFGDPLVSFDFPFCELGRGRVLSHDAVGDFVVEKEIAVR